jgi:ATP-dependent helicase HrpB
MKQRESFSYIIDLTTKMAIHQQLPVLPIDSFLPAIQDAVKNHPSVIIVAEPGAGKTTRVPVVLAKNSRWIVLQPRRWAAKLTAKRIAEENGWRLGEEVGYQIRFENKTSKNTRILIMTEGVLLRKLIQDPELKGFDGVVLDEFHERSLDLDLAISILKEIQDSFRPDLKLVIMSATLDPAPLEAFLGPETKAFQIPGRTFPVHKRYLGEVTAASAVKTALAESKSEDGDILIFLPGAFEIERAVRDIKEQLAQSNRYDFVVLPLYSSLSDADQKRVFDEGRDRKIICSTNIAETSITLPKVKVVIDSGWAKVMRTDPQLGQDRLETVRISRASSEQRAGRAGRVSEGICYRLWTEAENSQLRRFETPEIHRVHLGQALLFLADFGVSDFTQFNWYEAPKSSMLQFSVRELEQLGFLLKGSLTDDGKQALRIPLSPKFAKLVMVAEKKRAKAFGARLAAYLENRSSDEAVTNESQLIRYLNQLSGLAMTSARQIFGSNEVPTLNESEWDLYESILIEALPMQVFIDEKIVGRRKVSGKGRPLPKAGLILQSMERNEWNHQGGKGVPTIQIQSFVELALSQIELFSQKKKTVFWDESLEKVRALEGKFFLDLEVGSVHEAAVDATTAAEVLTDQVLKNPIEVFSKNESFRAWHERVEFFNRLSDTKMCWNWAEVAPLATMGKTRLNDVIQFSIVKMIEGQIDRRLLKQFEEWVPEKIEVPSEQSHRIDYSGDKPKLSVRLQEVFGWLDTPRLAGGKAPLLIELLSPRFEAMQVTQDLKSFWASTYFEVKKELKARYPKHAWPEDPLTAKAEAKGRRRR